MKIKRKRIQVFIDIPASADDGDVPEIICQALADVVAAAKDDTTIDWPSLLISSNSPTRVHVVTDTGSTDEGKTLRLIVDLVTKI